MHAATAPKRKEPFHSHTRCEFMRNFFGGIQVDQKGDFWAVCLSSLPPFHPGGSKHKINVVAAWYVMWCYAAILSMKKGPPVVLKMKIRSEWESLCSMGNHHHVLLWAECQLGQSREAFSEQNRADNMDRNTIRRITPWGREAVFSTAAMQAFATPSYVTNPHVRLIPLRICVISSLPPLSPTCGWIVDGHGLMPLFTFSSPQKAILSWKHPLNLDPTSNWCLLLHSSPSSRQKSRFLAARRQ